MSRELLLLLRPSHSSAPAPDPWTSVSLQPDETWVASDHGFSDGNMLGYELEYVSGTVDLIVVQKQVSAFVWTNIAFLSPLASYTIPVTDPIRVYNDIDGDPAVFRYRAPGTSSPLLTNLVAYYKLGEASDIRFDATNRGNDLTPINAPANAVGKQGNALEIIQASDQEVSTSTTTDLAMGDIDFTLALWVYANDPAGATEYPSPLGKWVPDKEYILYYEQSSGSFGFEISADGTTSTTVRVASPLVQGDWYFIVARHKASTDTIDISVNAGTPESTTHSGGCYNGGSPFELGYGYGNIAYGWGHWDGRIDEVGVWKRYLSDAEVTSLYAGGNGVTYPFS